MITSNDYFQITFQITSRKKYFLVNQYLMILAFPNCMFIFHRNHEKISRTFNHFSAEPHFKAQACYILTSKYMLRHWHFPLYRNSLIHIVLLWSISAPCSSTLANENENVDSTFAFVIASCDKIKQKKQINIFYIQKSSLYISSNTLTQNLLHAYMESFMQYLKGR